MRHRLRGAAAAFAAACVLFVGTWPVRPAAAGPSDDSDAALLARLEKGDAEAAAALAKRGAAVAPALVTRVGGADAKAAAAAGDVLVAMGAPAVPALDAALQTAAVPAAAVELDVLGRIAADHDEAVEPLAKSLAHKDAKVRAAAARGLLAAGDRAKPKASALTALLVDRFIEVRVAAGAALIRCAGPNQTALACVMAGVADKDAAVRAMSLECLAKSRAAPDKTAPPLLLAAAKDADASVRLVALRMLPMAAAAAPWRDQAIERLVAATRDPSRDHATAAIRALVAMQARDVRAVVDALGRAAVSDDAALRAEALAAIPKLTDEPLVDVTRFGGAYRGDRTLRRDLAALGGGNDTETAVAVAIAWLARHRARHGGWSSSKFEDACTSNRCGGAGQEGYDVGVTGLSLLAFLGAGHTHQRGRYKDVVGEALDYLRGVQGRDGCFGDRDVPGYVYSHAIATLAACEAYMLTTDEALKERAQLGLDFIHQAKGTAGWRYSDSGGAEADTSVTGWMAYALAVGRAAGLRVDDADLRTALTWVEAKTDPDTGRTGYMRRGYETNRSTEMGVKFPAALSEACTAIGVSIRFFSGRAADKDPLIGKGAKLFVPPSWNEKDGRIDFYYWFWGALSMRQVGGDGWKKWNDFMKRALVAHQRMEVGVDEHGSWDPVDPWSVEGGRIYSTAMCCLCLESYYRMDPLADGR